MKNGASPLSLPDPAGAGIHHLRTAQRRPATNSPRAWVHLEPIHACEAILGRSPASHGLRWGGPCFGTGVPLHRAGIWKCQTLGALQKPQLHPQRSTSGRVSINDSQREVWGAEPPTPNQQGRFFKGLHFFFGGGACSFFFSPFQFYFSKDTLYLK